MTPTTEPTLPEILLGRIRGEPGLGDPDLQHWLDVLVRSGSTIIDRVPTLTMVRVTTKGLADDGLIVWEGEGWSRVIEKPKPEKLLF